MKKRSLFLLTLLCFCSLGFAQNDQSCRADLQSLKLPDHAFIDDVPELSQPPVSFLFSQDGVDVYSATDFKTMRFLNRFGQPFANAVTVILVYQDEQVRQRKIESLRKDVARIDHFERDNSHAPLENLKFATWRFELTPVWVDNVLTRQWLVSGMAYFEPESCEPMESRSPAWPKGYLEASMNWNRHNSIVGWMPPITLPENQRTPPIHNSILARTLETMRSILKSSGLPN